MRSSSSRLRSFIEGWGRSVEAVCIDSPADPLWGPEYLSYDGDTAFRFLTEVCYTLDETQMPARVSLIPRKEYIRVWCHQAIAARRAGVTHLLVKSRRMVMSWVATAFDLWESGIYGSGQYVVASRNMDMSAELLWRTAFMYGQIQVRHPEWGLPKLREREDIIRWKGAKQFQQVRLPNWSLYVALSGEAPDNMRQFPARRIRLEEIGTWTYPAYAYSTAQYMVQARPGEVGGNVTIISTAYPGWLRAQRVPADKRRVLGRIEIPESEYVGLGVSIEPGVNVPEDILVGSAVLTSSRARGEGAEPDAVRYVLPWG